jgi:hypothetical protein
VDLEAPLQVLLGEQVEGPDDRGAKLGAERRLA